MAAAGVYIFITDEFIDIYFIFRAPGVNQEEKCEGTGKSCSSLFKTEEDRGVRRRPSCVHRLVAGQMAARGSSSRNGGRKMLTSKTL